MRTDTKNIFQREGIWWIDKRFKAKRHRFSLETRSVEEAQGRRDRIIADMVAGRWSEQRARTFNEAVDRWLDEHLPALKPKSSLRYKVSLVHLLDEYDGEFLTAIRSARLGDFEQQRRGQGVSTATIRRDLACLSSLLSSCEEWEWLDSNPVKAFMRARGKKGLTEGLPRIRYLTHAEEAATLSEAGPTGATAMAFAIDTGLRKEEQFSLLKDDVDQSKWALRIRKEVTKTTRPRLVFLNDRARDIARRLINANDSPYLFTTYECQRYSDGSPTMYEALQKATRRAGIQDRIRWHDLRRTCGTRLLQDYGYTLQETSHWLGHSSVKVTERSYAFLNEERLGDKLLSRDTKQATANRAATLNELINR